MKSMCTTVVYSFRSLGRALAIAAVAVLVVGCEGSRSALQLRDASAMASDSSEEQGERFSPLLLCDLATCDSVLAIRLVSVGNRDFARPEGEYVVRLFGPGFELGCSMVVVGADPKRCISRSSGFMLAFSLTAGLNGVVLVTDEIGTDVRRLPDKVSASVSLDGVVLGAATFDLDYRVRQPNGPHCSPTCWLAEVRLPLGFQAW